MRNITLVGIRLESFKSFAKPTAMSFTTAPGMKFITGVNHLEPRLGANGVGKSSLWDGLLWCLYGRGVRGKAASDLVTWGHKRPQVTTTLDIDGEVFEIRRIGCPEAIFVDEEPTNQEGLNHLLGLSYARFMHSVLFGQGVAFFIDLPMAERAALLDEVLDLSIWLRASDEAATRVKELGAQIVEAKLVGERAGGVLQGLEDPAELDRKAEAWDREAAERLDAAIARVEQAELQLADLRMETRRARQLYAETDQRALSQFQSILMSAERELAGLEADYRRLIKDVGQKEAELATAGTSTTCSTCGQPIKRSDGARHANHVRAALEALRTEIQSNGARSNGCQKRRDTARAEYDKAKRISDFRHQQLANTQANEQAQERIVDSLVAQAEQIGEATQNPFEARAKEVRQQRQQTELLLETARQKQQDLEGKQALAQYWRAGFKRVRLFQIKQILAHLELEVAAAAEALGLPGWRIQFMTETETKSGTVKQGVQIKVSSPVASGAWELWSGGEGQRIRLAVAMGFAAMVQRMSGVNYTFEVWDESSAWLSQEGIEDLLECLRQRAETHAKSVWTIDHRALIHSGFAEIWQITKGAGGSVIQPLNM